MTRLIPNIENRELATWVQEIAALTNPSDIILVDGSDEENSRLIDIMKKSKTVLELNSKLRPGSYLARSNPQDVARVEDRTFICSEKEIDAGPTNNWKSPDMMKKELLPLFKGCMEGRTMYVVPYCMGPLNSLSSKIGVEITDSPYVVANMRIMTRIGKPVLKMLGQRTGQGSFVKCLHSVGMPLKPGVVDVSWPCNPQNTYIAHFPDTLEVWSFGSGYGGNALMNKKCFALRIASVQAKNEGWMAEHMLIVGLTNPKGKKRYFAASFPSACGKTNLAMLTSKLPGWKVECVGDDIAWMHWGKDGRLYAINPEAGFFGVAPGTSNKSNPNAMASVAKNTIFTNVGLTDDGDVWWEGMTDTPPAHLISWKGIDWHPGTAEKAAHPNARFTAPCAQCPSIDPDWENGEGVPISGIIFGGRRSSTVPLVRQALSWQNGVFFGASMSSETTAAAAGEMGKLRHDPFAMLPFCGYNMADYFRHWLKMADDKAHKLPEIFFVNWFQKDEQGNFIWPGFSENMRVLEWMFDRLEGTASATKTAIGYIPEEKNFDLKGLNLDAAIIKKLFSVDIAAWKEEADKQASYFKIFGDKMPRELLQEVEQLKSSL